MHPMAFLLGCLLAVGGAVRPAGAQVVAGVVDSTASLVEYTGDAVAHNWTGTSRDVAGRFRVDPAAPASSRLVVEAPVASFDSGNDRRDRKMREVTAASRHPTVRLEAERVEVPSWTAAGDSASGTWRVVGALTFHGRTHPVQVDVDVRQRGDRLRAQAQFDVSLTRYAVDRPRLLFVPIDDVIVIDVDVVADLDAAAAPAPPDSAQTDSIPAGGGGSAAGSDEPVDDEQQDEDGDVDDGRLEDAAGGLPGAGARKDDRRP